MALKDCLNPPPLVAAIAALLSLDSYFGTAPELVDYPYVLIGYNPTGFPEDLPLGGVADSVADELYLTVADTTPGNVEYLRGQVRQQVNPGGGGRLVDLAGGVRVWVKRGGISSPVAPDTTQPKLPQSNNYPMYAMDAYRLQVVA